MTRAFTAPKRGDTPNEDRWSQSSDGRIFVVSDGASISFDSAPWAELLCRRLSVISDPPSDAWVGKWVSVTGLVEPPYAGKHYGKPYKNVGITVTADNQIIRITDADAKFRLGGKGPPAVKVTAQTKNAGILTNLQGGKLQSPAAPTPQGAT